MVGLVLSPFNSLRKISWWPLSMRLFGLHSGSELFGESWDLLVMATIKPTVTVQFTRDAVHQQYGMSGL